MLRDGAAAQYGSDAIAGVMNFELKNARSGGSMEFRTGRYFDANDGDPATCGPIGRSCNGIGGNAPSFTFAGNTGLPLGPEGFLNLSLEYGGTQPTNRAVNDSGTQAVINGGNTHVRTTSRVWGSPLIEDDLKLFANFGTGGDRAEFYGHANYASKTVTGGFYYRNPNNRGNVYSVDGGQTLLVGDVLAAQGMGSANCPTVAVTNGTPDPAAFAQVRNNPNCFTFHQPFLGAPDGLPGGFTPQFGGDVYDYSLVSGVRGTTTTGLNWGRQRQHRPEPRADLHLRHRQRLARPRQPDPVRAQPAAADRDQPQRGHVVRGQRHDQRRRGARVAERGSTTSARATPRRGPSAPTACRASAPPRTATTAPGPRTPAPGTAPTSPRTATSRCTARPTSGTSGPRSASRTSTTASAPR